VSGLDKEAGSWDWTCCYYDFGKFSELTKAEALFKALDYYRMRTDERYISWARMREIATVLKDGLIEDGEEEAYRYMADVAELSVAEAEYFGLDMEQSGLSKTKMPMNTRLHPAQAAVTAVNPWDAPGMSTPDYI